MEIIKNEIDSMVTGKQCLDLTDFSKNIDFNEFENAYIKREKPFYVLCRIPVEEISNVHAIESCGFHFIEVQSKMTHKIKKKYPSLKQYEFTEVTSEDDLKKVQEIAATTFVDDRFIIDPLLDSEFACKRYIYNMFQTLFTLMTKNSISFQILKPEISLLLKHINIQVIMRFCFC